MNLSGIFNFPDLSKVSSGSPAVQNNKTSSASSGSVAQGPVKTDQADISSTGLAAAQNAAQANLVAGSASSDVRTALVNNIQSAIQSGAYNVPASDVAGRIIQGMLGNG